jgi:uncharacterized membrane protein
LTASLLLQGAGGVAFLLSRYPALTAFGAVGLAPLAYIGFWAPAVISLAGFIGAWRLYRAEEEDAAALLIGVDFALLSDIVLGWAVLWWGFVWLDEIYLFLPAPIWSHAVLLVAAGTGLAWLPVARLWQWRSLALLSTLLLPVTILSLLTAFDAGYNPAAHLGYLAWPAVLAVNLCLLRWIGDLLPRHWPGWLHILGCWLGLAVLTLEIRYGLSQFSDRAHVWRWLGWAAVPTLYLLAASRPRFPEIWPVTAFAHEYRTLAAVPVALVLLPWLWLSALLSDGDARPLPWLPLLNPLELGQALALYALLSWYRARFQTLLWAARLPRDIGYWVLGASALLVLSGTVLRTAHHWAGIPFTPDTLIGSLLVQASLSMLWAMTALGLMIFGHVRALRLVWITGAVLAAIVVAKLYLIELNNSGGLPRIIFFIGIGGLLLITGYFAPLPPRRPAPAP